MASDHDRPHRAASLSDRAKTRQIVGRKVDRFLAPRLKRAVEQLARERIVDGDVCPGFILDICHQTTEILSDQHHAIQARSTLDQRPGDKEHVLLHPVQ